MAAIAGWGSTNLIGDGEPEQVGVASATQGLFEILGISPALGRSFAVEEYRYGAESVGMITD